MDVGDRDARPEASFSPSTFRASCQRQSVTCGYDIVRQVLTWFVDGAFDLYQHGLLAMWPTLTNMSARKSHRNHSQQLTTVRIRRLACIHFIHGFHGFRLGATRAERLSPINASLTVEALCRSVTERCEEGTILLRARGNSGWSRLGIYICEAS
jgi:hypothetical protein